MSKELIKIKDRFDKIVHFYPFQGRNIMIQYLKREKWGIAFFLIVYITLFISSYLLIDGPATGRRTDLCIFGILFRSIS